MLESDSNALPCGSVRAGIKIILILISRPPHAKPSRRRGECPTSPPKETGFM
ncbi:hypothetical protein K443DRAFT_680578 [Laccaria amethystina LaAM-08-1]|uniref:Uncharacterized protein n=1 Tax=Laccaria amethystina LaAM-08-1 TaxID=1095629 RepID=A0A0C9XRT1_9AGAR|nr:hypothetical protein K443DRAFT_680578 [Laccaria amethystina LaAM-08-1]